jgi:hypothetical protein
MRDELKTFGNLHGAAVVQTRTGTVIPVTLVAAATTEFKINYPPVTTGPHRDGALCRSRSAPASRRRERRAVVSRITVLIMPPKAQ